MILAAIAVAGGLGVVLSRQPIYSVLSLVLTMVALAALYLVLSAPFVFAVQIIVYAGAVMVLFLFVIALLGPIREGPSKRLAFQTVMSALFVLALFFLFFGMLQGLHFRPTDTSVAISSFGSVDEIATGLFGEYLYPFELTSILLLVAAIGAIYLSRRPEETEEPPTE